MKKAPRPHIERRSRGEIDRNYFFGDVFIKTGVAVMLAICLIALYTPFTLADEIRDRQYGYLGVMTTFGAIGVLAYLLGRHLRQSATQWDFD
jgi:hypothetical protein